MPKHLFYYCSRAGTPSSMISDVLAAIREEFTMNPGDNLFTALTFRFAIAERINHLGGLVPDEWDYRPSMAGIDYDSPEYELLENVGDAILIDYRGDIQAAWQVEIAQLLHAGEVLAHYSNQLVIQGNSI